MDRNDLGRCLARELDRWIVKPYEALKTELGDVVAYSVGEGSEFYQVEVQLLESLPEYVHVSLGRRVESFGATVHELSCVSRWACRKA